MGGEPLGCQTMQYRDKKIEMETKGKIEHPILYSPKLICERVMMVLHLS